jgi:arylsulfatase A-like enzyme
LGGLRWAALWFCIDSLDALSQLEKASRVVRGDADTTATIRDAVAGFVARVALAHAVLGLFSSMWIHGWVRIWTHGEPLSGRRFAKIASSVVLLTSAALLVWQTTLFPRLHTYNPWLQAWVDTLTVPRLQALGALGAALLGALVLFRSWRAGALPVLARSALLLVLWVGAGWRLTVLPDARPARDNEGMNVVFIGVDALRPDHLGANGYDRPTSPNIDAFLAEAVLYTEAWTPLARTYPSWTSLLSGTLPITAGIRDNLPTPSNLVPDRAMLPQVLQAEGYHTRFATDDSRFSYMVPEGGWDAIQQPEVGMQNFAVSAREPGYRLFHALMHNRLGFWLVPAQAWNQAMGRSYRPTLFQEKVVDELALASEHDRFFFAAHSCVLHAPGDRAWPWHSLHGQAGVTLSNRFVYSRSGSALTEETNKAGESVKALAEQNVRIYDSGIGMADDLVGAVMAQLDQAGLLDNTIVVLFSDHGEEHWAPDLPYAYKGPNHGFHPYGEGQFRTLLAIRYPDGRGAGSRVEGAARLMDVVPTLARDLGLQWPEAIDGVALQELPNEDRDRLVYIETGASESTYWNAGHLKYPYTHISRRYRLDRELDRVYIRPKFKKAMLAAKDRVVQRGSWKLVYRPTETGPQLELFNRSEDPFNRLDVADQHPAILEELTTELRVFLALDGVELEPPGL